MDSPVFYDPMTDSMSVKIRPGASVGNRVAENGDLILDVGADGAIVGYDIQHASQHPEMIAEALRLLQKRR